VIQHVVHCGPLPAIAGATCTLNPAKPHRDVILDLSGIERSMGLDLAPIVHDLVLVGAYVLLADGALSRGNKDEPLAKKWHRDIVLRVPVTDPDLWRSASGALVDLLQWATDDTWHLEFRKGEDGGQLTLNLEAASSDKASCVALFSGGLDSLAGALRLYDDGEKPVLASHWTTDSGRINREKVVGQLRLDKPRWRFPNVALHTMRAPSGGNAKEYTQRSRGVLYLSLGVGVALQFGLDRLIVPENGVTSLNLEQSAQSVGAMRSRTTHPKTIALYRALLTSLGIGVSIETPFFDSTKGEVIKEAVARGGDDLAHLTVSCAHAMWSHSNEPHCGTCSQCVDRRFAGLWAGWDDATEAQQHAVDLFRDPLPAGEAATYSEQYVRFATDVLEMSRDTFIARKDVFRAVEDADDPTTELLRIHAVVRRHAEQISAAITDVWGQNQKDYLAGRLPGDGLLARIGSLGFRKADWLQCADRIVEVITPGLRKQFASSQPADEHEFQIAVDALQTAARLNLEREFPTVSYALIGTRPDFSTWANPDSLEPDLFIELKLVRTRAQVRKVVDEILADIPKYTQRGRKALFMVYDNGGFIADDRALAAPLEAQGEVRVTVLRR
jgi:hypothetical protein